MTRLTAPLAAALALLSPVGASAHELLHDVARGRAIAVRFYESDGESLASAPYQVYSPANPGTPFLEGRTDRSGWVAFVPDAPGRWRVKVVGDDGHGLDVTVDAAAPAASAGPSSAAFALRPLVGVAAIGAVFAFLFLLGRRKRASR
jgi:nickel transport protein